jgi:hypothetical protein
MADRKISELGEARRVFDGDYLVVVTGVGQFKNPADPSQGYVDYVTTRVPISGLSTWSFRINEMVSGCTGIQIIPAINTGLTPPGMNKISICTTGVSYSGHTHTSSDITNFGSSVSGLVEQRIKVLSAPVSKTGTLTSINDLSFDVTANTKYLCEVGLIVSGTTTSTQFSGLVSSTGIAASNSNLLLAYGTWNYNERTASDGKNYSTATPVTGVCLIGSGINNGNMTLVNKFTVQTYVTEADRLTVQFGTNNTDGAILAGSWFKAEKVI